MTEVYCAFAQIFGIIQRNYNFFCKTLAVNGNIWYNEIETDGKVDLEFFNGYDNVSLFENSHEKHMDVVTVDNEIPH